jgi:Fur family transcriptional regulator, ferric uptake regulator
VIDAEALLDDLRSEGLRITAARRAICDTLAAGVGEHLDAQEIRKRAQRSSGLRIDLSTIYRTIDVLEQLGALHHVHLGHGPAIVHLEAASDHQHLVCERCGRTVDVPLGEVSAVFADLASAHGFAEIRGTHFAIVGLCLGCSDKS